MARKLRVPYSDPTAIHNACPAGAPLANPEREAIFDDDEAIVSCKPSAKHAADPLAGARLLPHEQSLSSGERNAAAQPGGRDELALGTYTSRFNRRHQQFGHLFHNRFISVPNRSQSRSIASNRVKIK